MRTRVETLDCERPVIPRGEGGNSVGDAPVAVEPALEFADDGRPACYDAEQRGEGRRALAGSSDPHMRDVSCALVDERAGGPGQAVEPVVVKDEDFLVCAHLHVAFDGVTGGDRGLSGGKGVLDHAVRGVMQTAVRDRPFDQPARGVWARLLQDETSNTASTSASAFSGRWATPTVARAWRPRSPKTSAIRSEAPFIAWARAS